MNIICDAGYLITNEEEKLPGSVHDFGIFRESTLKDRFACGKFKYSTSISYDLYVVSCDCN